VATETNLSLLKHACALIRGINRQGTGYLIGPATLATCAHVAGEQDDRLRVSFDFDGVERKAKVTKVDTLSDSAIVKLAEPVDGVEPLTLSSGCEGEAVWRGFGYGKVVNGAGAVVTGSVRDPAARDDLKTPSLQLYSPEAAAGMAARLNGFSGSPICVGNQVVGHLKRILSDPDNPGKPALGILYATPATAVLELAGLKGGERTAAQKASGLLRLPPLSQDEYHVVLSHRSTDAVWAKELVTRLTHGGFRVFTDQRELDWSEMLEARQQAIERTRSALIIVSPQWLLSKACLDEAAALLARAASNNAFRIVVARLGDVTLPETLSKLPCVDFESGTQPAGAGLQNLMFKLAGQEAPLTGSAESELIDSETELVDRMLSEIRDASHAGPQRVFRLWKQWHELGLPAAAPGLSAAQTLISAAKPELALQVLNGVPDSLRTRQLKALAFSKVDQDKDAIEILEQLQKSGALDAESGGLLAGRYKKLWYEHRDDPEGRDWLIKSRDLYWKTYKETGDAYPGINAATTSLLLNVRSEAAAIAAEVWDIIEAMPADKPTYWDLATKAEAALLMNKLELAELWYVQAVAESKALRQDVAVMRKQARLVLKAGGYPVDALDSAFGVPRVAVFQSATGLQPSQENLRKLRHDVREAIRARNLAYGFSCVSSPLDLVFVQEILRSGGNAALYLRGNADEAESAFSDAGWRLIFRRITREPRVEIHPLPASSGEDVMEILQSDAAKQAKTLDEELVVITWGESQASAQANAG